MCLPKFKYHPNAYKLELGIFTNEQGVCSVCNQPRTLKYEGPIYSIEEPDYICPWCIADGLAAAKYDGQFSDDLGVEEVPEDKLEEIIYRTPGYVSWQQEVWLTHCNEPCAFIDYVGIEEIEPYFDELIDDIENLGYPVKVVKTALSKDGSLKGYLFECVNCGKKRIHIDCD